MKQDIKICKSNKELTDALEVFSNKNYESIIVQQFLEKKYEVCSYGCLINQHPYEVDIEHMKEIGGSVQKVREWPSTGGGSTVFAQFIDNDDLNDLKNCVLVILYQQGYRGQYDIEFLVCEDKIYLNEINFRHSGNGYGLIENGVSAPYIWCLDCAGEPIPKNIKINVIAGACHMDEMSDFSHRKGNHLTLHEWIKNVRKTKAFAVFNYKDLSGTWGFYRVKLKNAIKKLIK
jgi:formate-dependent phosphoribosylglycinamide formyltransferase (GAR transformylase)